MPRPKRVRLISSPPKCVKFTSDSPIKEKTRLTYEEYEAIHLMDYKHLTHDEAATMMNISRTTVTEIYESARCKIAEALCQGNDLLIEGGNYQIVSLNSRLKNLNVSKEGKNMIKKIAVTYQDGNVFQHFGKTEYFKIYRVEDKKIISSEVVSTNGQGHGALAVFLLNQTVELLICGGIGGGAITALGQAGIKILPGIQGNCDEAVQNYLDEVIKVDEDFQNDPHKHTCNCEHHGEHRDCGEEHHHDGCGCHHDK